MGSSVWSNALAQINLNAAGIDIGAEELWVAVHGDRDEINVRSFATFTADLYGLADCLLHRQGGDGINRSVLDPTV